MDELKSQIDEARAMSSRLNWIDGLFGAFIIFYCSWELITGTIDVFILIDSLFIFIATISLFLIFKYGRPRPLPKEQSRENLINYFEKHLEREYWFEKYAPFISLLPFTYLMGASMFFSINMPGNYWAWFFRFVILLAVLYIGFHIQTNYFGKKRQWLEEYKDRI